VRGVLDMGDREARAHEQQKKKMQGLKAARAQKDEGLC
jgi:hypothetical protein